jgi:nucleoside-diphosphate-sugar epimerase
VIAGTVVVTGGTGFIGGRLVERLALETPASIRVLVKRFGSASRVARFPVDMVQVDLGDPDAVSEAVTEADVVVHTAFDFADLPFNLRAAENLARACLRHGVDRFVQISTFSVYEPFPDGTLDESSPRGNGDSPYAKTKYEIEEILRAMHQEHGLPVTVLQPTVVYGPFAGTWTIDPVEKLRKGRVVLPGQGEGLCNAVYVDDVVGAIFSAAVGDRAVGERLLVSGSNPVTWREFFGSYEQMLGVENLDFMPAESIARAAAESGPSAVARRLTRDPHRILDYGWAKVLYWKVKQLLGERTWSKIQRTIPPHVSMPDAERLALYASRASVDVSRARDLLGWEPQFDLARGMKYTGEYIRWARL